VRVLNLYAGIGGNRALWPADAEVTAVEFDEATAQAYRNMVNPEIGLHIFNAALRKTELQPQLTLFD
jgi:hypothetical protein